MAVIESKFFNDGKCCQVTDGRPERRELVAAGHSSPGHQWVGHNRVDRADNQEVEGTQLDGLDVLGSLDL